MSVKPILGPGDALGGPGARMSNVDAVAVVAISAGVVTLLVVADPKDALWYLLAFPIWIVAKDLGLIAGSVAAACALLFVLIFGTGARPARVHRLRGRVRRNGRGGRRRVAVERRTPDCAPRPCSRCSPYGPRSCGSSRP